VVRARSGRLSALRVLYSESVLYAAFVWARRLLNSPKRRFPARAAVVLYRAGGALLEVSNASPAPRPRGSRELSAARLHVSGYCRAYLW
jgi:hypothetical protein